MSDSSAPTQQITAWLSHWHNGDLDAGNLLADAVHPVLRQIAARHLHNERGSHTLEQNALVNELWVRIMDGRKVAYENRSHFFAAAAHTMRYILIDHARARLANKRGGKLQQISLTAVEGWNPIKQDEDVLLLDQSLTKLATVDPRAARVVELRFFGGLSEEETADVLGVPYTQTPYK